MPYQGDRILVLHEQGICNYDIARKLGVAPPNVGKAIKWSQELGYTGDRPRSGRKSTINTTRESQLMKKRVQRNSTVSMRNIPVKPVCRISEQLQLKPYKLQMAKLLTAGKRVRLERCRRLLRSVAPLNWERILYTDEKLFTIEQAHNHQNDRSWCAEAPGTSAIVEHRQIIIIVRILPPWTIFQRFNSEFL